MSRLQAILHERCPRCRQGAIFRCSLWRGWLSMHERCPVCNLKFEREQGYFLGAMYVSYALAIPPFLLLVTAFWLFAHWRYELALVGAFIAYLPFVPKAARFSRVVWMYIDHTLDPVGPLPDLRGPAGVEPADRPTGSTSPQTPSP